MYFFLSNFVLIRQFLQIYFWKICWAERFFATKRLAVSVMQKPHRFTCFLVLTRQFDELEQKIIGLGNKKVNFWGKVFGFRFNEGEERGKAIKFFFANRQVPQCLSRYLKTIPLNIRFLKYFVYLRRNFWIKHQCKFASSAF